MDVSYTELAAYKACPKRFKYRRDGASQSARDPRHAWVGRTLQRLVEEFYKERRWMDPAAVDTWARDRAMAIGNFIREKDGIVFDGLTDAHEWWGKVMRAVPVILDTIKRERLIGRRNLAEEETKMRMVDTDGAWHDVHGRLDLVILDGASLTVLDGKGGASIGRFADTDQLRLYALQARERWGRYPDRVGFWWYRHGVVQWKTIREKSLLKFTEGLKQRLAGIAAGLFEATPGSTKCRMCDYKRICPEGQAAVLNRTDDFPVEGLGPSSTMEVGFE